MAFEFCCLIFLTGLKVYCEEILHRVDPAPNDVTALDFGAIQRGWQVQRMPSRLSLEALGNDMSRSGRIGRMPSKLSLGVPSDVSRSRMGASANSSLGESHARSSPSFFTPALAGQREENIEDDTRTAGYGAGDAAVGAAGDHQA